MLLTVHVLESRTYNTVLPAGFTQFARHAPVSCYLEIHCGGNRNTLAVACIPVDRVEAETLALAR